MAFMGLNVITGGLSAGATAPSPESLCLSVSMLVCAHSMWIPLRV